jgi:hypothetical protein
MADRVDIAVVSETAVEDLTVERVQVDVPASQVTVETEQTEVTGG